MLSSTRRSLPWIANFSDGSRLKTYSTSKHIKKNTSFVQVSPALGAAVSDIDLSSPLDQKIQHVIQEALDTHCALVFRDQDFNPEMIKQNLSYLGSPAIEQQYVDQGLTVKGNPEWFVLRNDKDNPPLFDFWHTDKTAWKIPVMYTVLYCKEMPEIGGDTLVANTRKAYDSLSEGMKQTLSKMNAVYNERNAFVNNDKVVAYLQNKGFDPSGAYDHFKDQVHPIVRRNPRNFKNAIYFSPPYFSHMEGFTKEESIYFQNVLLQSISKPEFVFRHRWKKRDLLVIDNSCTSHYAAADFFPRLRELNRMIITRGYRELS